MAPFLRPKQPGAWAAVALATGLLMGIGACDANLNRPWNQDDADRLETLRVDLEALTEVQTVLQWYTASQGEPSILSETYQTSGELFNRDSIQLVKKALERPGLSQDETRSLEYLKNHLAIESIRVQTARLDDQAQNAETNYRVKLSWLDEPIPFRELDTLLGQERAPERREEIHNHMTRFWKDVINPILAEKEDLARKLAVQAGYESYIALCEAYRGAKLVPLAEQSRAFLDETNDLYEQLLDEEARDVLGHGADQMRRSDINFLANPPRYNDYFPPDLQMAAFEHLLSGIGLNLKTAAGTEIRVDDSPNPLKDTIATAYAVRVPEDIRINLRPVGGLDDFTSLFYEGARALHFGWTTTQTWEFQHIGPMATSEGYGEFFNYVWSDPRWLVRYRNFVIAHNEANPDAQVPVMTYDDLSRLVRHRVFWDLYFLRRYAFARLTYEYFLHGGDPAGIQKAYKADTSNLQEVYRDLFSDAYGFALNDQEALRFRTDTDDFLLSLDYARSFLFAHSLHEAVRGRFGYNWYESTQVGPTLKRLWAGGTQLQPEEALTTLGQDTLDFTAVKERLQRLLKEAEALNPDAPGDAAEDPANGR